VSGLITLVDVQEVAAATGVSVRIAGAAPSVRRLVELAGLTERFTRGSPAVRADRFSRVQDDRGPAVLNNDTPAASVTG
jgi:hypothetical protein